MVSDWQRGHLIDSLMCRISLYVTVAEKLVVNGVGVEPTMFTLWERIYSPLRHRRRRCPFLNLVRQTGL